MRHIPDVPRQPRPARAASFTLIPLVVCCLGAATAHAREVRPGHDLFQIQPGSTQTFAGPYAIPADFFGPGSEPFTGQVTWLGTPVPPLPTCPELFSNVHAVLRRPVGAQLSDGGGTVVVPLELVALDLVSAQPITVDYAGGPAEQWSVHMTYTLPETPLPGSVQLSVSTSTGGSFVAQVSMAPRFWFERVSPGPTLTRELDLGAVGFVDVLVTAATPWCYSGPSWLLEAGCDSNFKPGVVGGGAVGSVTLHGPWSTLVLQWPYGGAIPDRQTTWGAIKASFGN